MAGSRYCQSHQHWSRARAERRSESHGELPEIHSEAELAAFLARSAGRVELGELSPSQGQAIASLGRAALEAFKRAAPEEGEPSTPGEVIDLYKESKDALLRDQEAEAPPEAEGGQGKVADG